MSNKGTRWTVSKRRLAEVDDALAEVEEALLRADRKRGLDKRSRFYRDLVAQHRRLSYEQERITLGLFRRHFAARRKKGLVGVVPYEEHGYDPRGK